MSFKIGPHVVSRGALIPYEDKWRGGQMVQEDGNGGVIVSGKNYNVRFFRAVIRIPRDEALRIGGYLANNVKLTGTIITLVDGFGTTRSVRFWDNEVSMLSIASDLVEMDLLFREEVA